MRIFVTILAIGTGLWAEHQRPELIAQQSQTFSAVIIPAGLSGAEPVLACKTYWDV